MFRIISSENKLGNLITLDESLSGIYKLILFTTTNNLYNITDNNNKIYVKINLVLKTATLTNGSYDSTDLKSHMETILTALEASTTFTITLDSNTNKYTFTSIGNHHSFEFADNTTNSARKLLGFDEENTLGASFITTSTNGIQLSPNKIIYMRLREEDNQLVQGQNHFLASFFLYDNSSFGDVFRYENDKNYIQSVKFNRNKNLTSRFYDENWNDIDLNGSDWTLILQRIGN